MDKGEEEDRKLLLKRLEKERKILELLEEVNMSIPSNLSHSNFVIHRRTPLRVSTSVCFCQFSYSCILYEKFVYFMFMFCVSYHFNHWRHSPKSSRLPSSAILASTACVTASASASH